MPNKDFILIVTTRIIFMIKGAYQENSLNSWKYENLKWGKFHAQLGVEH